MKKSKQEAEAIYLQTEVGHVYFDRNTGRRVRIEMINAQLIVDEKGKYYEVLVSARELDLNSPRLINLVEKATLFFGNYIAA
jgi:ribosomal protein L28